MCVFVCVVLWMHKFMYVCMVSVVCVMRAVKYVCVYGVVCVWYSMCVCVV